MHLVTHLGARVIAPALPPYEGSLVDSTPRVGMQRSYIINGGRESGQMTWTSDRITPAATWNGGMLGYPPQTFEWHLGFIYQTYTRSDIFLSFAGSPSPITQHRLIVVPYWSIVAAFAMLPAAWVTGRVYARRRVRAGHCPHCGYDLRASPDRCPECGEIQVSDRLQRA